MKGNEMLKRLLRYVFGCRFNITHVCQHFKANGIGNCSRCGRPQKHSCLECRKRDHMMKKAMSWSIETQNDKTPFLADFVE